MLEPSANNLHGTLRIGRSWLYIIILCNCSEFLKNNSTPGCDLKPELRWDTSPRELQALTNYIWNRGPAWQLLQSDKGCDRLNYLFAPSLRPTCCMNYEVSACHVINIGFTASPGQVLMFVSRREEILHFSETWSPFQEADNGVDLLLRTPL